MIPEEKVFGIGLSKTGTTSLGHALNLLGIKTIHFPSDQKTFADLSSGNFRLSILETYQGAVDISVAPYYAQLDQIYPGSKFILTTRAIDSWIHSVRSHRALEKQNSGSPFIKFIRAVTYGSLEFQEDRFRFVFQQHTVNVCNYFSKRPNDFLMLDICSGEGWEKLCKFLGIAVPDIPFPKANDSQTNLRWAESIDAAVKSLEKLIPSGTRYVVVGNGKLGLPGSLPLENRDGLDWGAASDDEGAIQEVEELRREDVRYLVFLFPYFWWFDFYTDLTRYLEANFRCLKRNEHFVIYEIQPPP